MKCAKCEGVSINRTAHAGHVQCLRKLVEQGHALDETLFVAAASQGHLNCVTYLCEIGRAHV